MPLSASDIVLGLALAALIGGGVGWLLRGLRRDAAANVDQDRLITLELDRAAARGREQALAAAVRAAEERAAELGRTAEHEVAVAKTQVTSLMQERTTHVQARGESEARNSRLLVELADRDRELQQTLVRTGEHALRPGVGVAETQKPALLRLNQDLEAAQGEVARLAAALRQAKTDREQLEIRLAEADATRLAEIAAHEEQEAQQREALRGHLEQLETLQVERDEQARVAGARGAECQRLSEEIAAVRRQSPDPDQVRALEIEADRLRTRLLERERDLEEFRRAALALASGPPGSPLRGPVDLGARPPARQRRGSQASRDDLKRIRGIGPVLERTLNRMGITRFSQIARWQDRDVERVTPALGDFPDRIRRDRWIESDREEHIHKYGHDPLADTPAATTE